MRSGFPNDYALAIADSARETSTRPDALRPDPVGVPVRVGPAEQPVPHGPPDRRHRRAVGVLLPPGHDLDERLRVQRDVDGTRRPTSTTPAPPARRARTTRPTTRPRSARPGPRCTPSCTASSPAAVTTLTYDQVWTALKDTDQDPTNTNNVIEVYSGRSIAKSDNGGGVDQWNREHVWAKSHGDFGTVNGPGTDVHHLRPEDVTVNSTRGNLDFDNGGSAVAQCTGCLERQ